ncbi:MAG: hypothetical protein PHD81_04775 [Candidatus Nanoarchaeia archaeon]|nr:hypothetical protein [Candidatus Nanoarchaeia archaeon]MDD5588391.1 hypothetical protein [Candidatus Nanoarchaeia archaeon]
MKLGFKRLLAGIALTGFSLLAKAEAKFDSYSDRIVLTEKNRKYAGRKVVNREEKVAGWYIVDITDEKHKNVIGDEKYEEKQYRDLAFMFEMEKDMPIYYKTIENASNGFKKILAAQLGVEALRFTYNTLVDIEGSLGASVATGGANLSGEGQKYLVREIFGDSLEEINQTFSNNLESKYSEIEKKVKAINSKDLEKIISGEESEYVNDLKKLLIKELNKSVHTKLSKAIVQLELAIKYALENNRSLAENEKMFKSLVEGISVGFGVTAYYVEMNENNSMDNLARTIIIRGSKGAGVPLNAVINNKKILEALKEENHYQNAVKKSAAKTREWQRKLYITFNTNWEGERVERLLDYIQENKPKEKKPAEPIQQTPKENQPQEIILKEGTMNIDLNNDGVKESITSKFFYNERNGVYFNYVIINNTPQIGSCSDMKLVKTKNNEYNLYVTKMTDVEPDALKTCTVKERYSWNGGIPVLESTSGEPIQQKPKIEVTEETKQTKRRVMMNYLASLFYANISYFSDYNQFPPYYSGNLDNYSKHFKEARGLEYYKNSFIGATCNLIFNPVTTSNFIAELKCNLDNDNDLEIWRIDEGKRLVQLNKD